MSKLEDMKKQKGEGVEAEKEKRSGKEGDNNTITEGGAERFMSKLGEHEESLNMMRHESPEGVEAEKEKRRGNDGDNKGGADEEVA